MDELIKLVSQKTGIPQDKAKIAVDTVIAFLKQKLPAPLAGQLDTVLSGNMPQDLAQSLGGLLGKK